MLLAVLLELPAPNHHALQLLSCRCSSKMGVCGHTQCHRRAVRQALWALKCVCPTDPYLAQVSILTDDESILSTQLQHHWRQGQSCSLPTVSQSGLRGTRERYQYASSQPHHAGSQAASQPHGLDECTGWCLACDTEGPTRMTAFPTPVLPTKMTLSTPPVTSALPASLYPVTMCTRSCGAPAWARKPCLLDGPMRLRQECHMHAQSCHQIAVHPLATQECAHGAALP